MKIEDLLIPGSKNLLRDPDRIIPSPDGAIIVAWVEGNEIFECDLDVEKLKQAIELLPEAMEG